MDTTLIDLVNFGKVLEMLSELAGGAQNSAVQLIRRGNSENPGSLVSVTTVIIFSSQDEATTFRARACAALNIHEPDVEIPWYMSGEGWHTRLRITCEDATLYYIREK